MSLAGYPFQIWCLTPAADIRWHSASNHALWYSVVMSHTSWPAESFYTYIAPAALAYYVAAILVILPGTRPIRLGVLPLKLWLFFRAGTSVNVVEACGDPSYKFLDYFISVSDHISQFVWQKLSNPLTMTAGCDSVGNAYYGLGVHLETLYAAPNQRYKRSTKWQGCHGRCEWISIWICTKKKLPPMNPRPF